MKFTHSHIPRVVTPANTPRRLANAARAIERQRTSWGMFPELAPQETPEERLARLDREMAFMFQHLRDLDARAFRRGRAFLRRVPSWERCAFLCYYERMMARFPSLGTGVGFATLVGMKFPKALREARERVIEELRQERERC